MKVPQLWQKWDTIRAQTGGFDKINLQGMSFTGSLDIPFVAINFFSSGRISGSSSGELCAYSSQNSIEN
jgi:hypothetical protein